MTDLEEQRFSKVFKKLGSGGFFSIKVVLGSRAFRRCFALDLKKMAFNCGDNAEDEPEEGTVLVAGNENESHHF